MSDEKVLSATASSEQTLPTTPEEAIDMMRFGCPWKQRSIAEYDVPYFERRMQAAADLFERTLDAYGEAHGRAAEMAESIRNEARSSSEEPCFADWMSNTFGPGWLDHRAYTPENMSAAFVAGLRKAPLSASEPRCLPRVECTLTTGCESPAACMKDGPRCATADRRTQNG